MSDHTPAPLDAREEAEIRRMIPGHPRETLDAGAWFSPTTVARLLATLDAERRMADTEVTALREALDAARTDSLDLPEAAEDLLAAYVEACSKTGWSIERNTVAALRTSLDKEPKP